MLSRNLFVSTLSILIAVKTVAYMELFTSVTFSNDLSVKNVCNSAFDIFTVCLLDLVMWMFRSRSRCLGDYLNDVAFRISHYNSVVFQEILFEFRMNRLHQWKNMNQRNC